MSVPRTPFEACRPSLVCGRCVGSRLRAVNLLSARPSVSVCIYEFHARARIPGCAEFGKGDTPAAGGASVSEGDRLGGEFVFV